MKAIILAAVTLFGGALAVQAEAATLYSGSDLLERCESESVARRNTCMAYLAGINDITFTYDYLGVLNRRDFCIPDSVNLGQLARVAIKGLNEKPEKLHLEASDLVANIFAEAFPCD